MYSKKNVEKSLELSRRAALVGYSYEEFRYETTQCRLLMMKIVPEILDLKFRKTSICLLSIWVFFHEYSRFVGDERGGYLSVYVLSTTSTSFKDN